MKPNIHSFQMSEGVHLQVHSTSKFKTQTICVSFIWPLQNEKLPLSFLLSYLLFDSCEKYDDKKRVLRQLDDLYGAAFSVTNDPFGMTDRLRFSISGIDAFLEEKLLEPLLETLAEFIFHPRFEEGKFPESMFRECLQQAMIAVVEERDDPYGQTLEQALRSYGGSAAAKILPELSEFEKITSQDCADHWRRILKEARIDIQILGSTDPETARAAVQRCLPFSPRPVDFPLLKKSHGKEVTLTMEKDIPQSHLVMLYETGIYSRDDQLQALLLGNGIFGSLPMSLLFQNVREAKGLCYSIDSRVLANDGILRAAAAAHSSKINEVKEGIERELEKMKRGDFSDDLLESARRMTVSSCNISTDIPGSILTNDYRMALNPKALTMEERIDRYLHVTREEIAAAFSKLKLRTTVILREGASHDL